MVSARQRQPVSKLVPGKEAEHSSIRALCPGADTTSASNPATVLFSDSQLVKVELLMPLGLDWSAPGSRGRFRFGPPLANGYLGSRRLQSCQAPCFGSVASRVGK